MMAIRPKERLVTSAIELFNLHGFHATGVDTILAQSKVAKTTLYRHFRSKEELTIAVLRKRDEDFRNWFMQAIDRANVQDVEKLLMVFDLHRQWAEQPDFNGCLFVRACGEFPDEDSPIHALCVEHKRLMKRYIKELSKAIDTVEPDSLTEWITILLEGATVSAQVTKRYTAFDDAKTLVKAVVQPHG